MGFGIEAGGGKNPYTMRTVPEYVIFGSSNYAVCMARLSNCVFTEDSGLKKQLTRT